MDIENILSQIDEQGLIDTKTCPYAANLNRNLKIAFHPVGGQPVIVKIFDRKSGFDDYQAALALKKYLDSFIVVPTQILQNQSDTATISPHVEHARMSLGLITLPRLTSQVQEIILGLHAAGTNIEVQVDSIAHETIITSAVQQLGLNTVFKNYLHNTVNKIFSALPEVNQHGDFTFTNLGIREGQRLIAFDWEDYGRIKLPGLDLATFLASLFHHGKLNDQIIHSPSNFLSVINEHFDQHLWHDLQISDDLFTFLFPAYLVTFWYLKKTLNYGFIEGRTLGVFERICSSTPWLDYIEEQSANYG